MKIFAVLTLAHAGNGNHIRMSGRARPDTYLFQRVPGLHHLHRMEMPIDEYRQKKADILQQPLPFPIDVDFRYEIEPSDIAGEARMQFEKDTADLREKYTAAQLESNRAHAELSALQEQVAANPTAEGGGISDEQKEFLNERDAMLDQLATYVEDENETPTGCLTRLLAELEGLRKGKTKKAKGTTEGE